MEFVLSHIYKRVDKIFTYLVDARRASYKSLWHTDVTAIGTSKMFGCPITSISHGESKYNTLCRDGEILNIQWTLRPVIQN